MPLLICTLPFYTYLIINIVYKGADSFFDVDMESGSRVSQMFGPGGGKSLSAFLIFFFLVCIHKYTDLYLHMYVWKFQIASGKISEEFKPANMETVEEGKEPSPVTTEEV